MTRRRLQATLTALLVVLSVGTAFAVAPAAATTQVDQELIDEVNDGIEETNDRLEADLYSQLEANDPPTHLEIEPVEAENQDELQDEYERLSEAIETLKTEMPLVVVEEINDRTEEKIGDRPLDPEDVETPDDARAAGDEFCDKYCDVDEEAEDAKQGLYDVADAIEEIEERWEPRLEQLEAAAYDDVEASSDVGSDTDTDSDEAEDSQNDETDSDDESEDSDEESSDDGLPGFGLGAAILALTAVALAGRRLNA